MQVVIGVLSCEDEGLLLVEMDRAQNLLDACSCESQDLVDCGMGLALMILKLQL